MYSLHAAAASSQVQAACRGMMMFFPLKRNYLRHSLQWQTTKRSQCADLLSSFCPFFLSWFPAALDDLLRLPTSSSAAQVCDSPGVREEAVEDAGPAVLGCQNHRLPQVVVLLLCVSGAAHHSGLHEGGPGVGQQVPDASLVHLRGRRKGWEGAQWSGVSFTFVSLFSNL